MVLVLLLNVVVMRVEDAVVFCQRIQFCRTVFRWFDSDVQTLRAVSPTIAMRLNAPSCFGVCVGDYSSMVTGDGSMLLNPGFVVVDLIDFSQVMILGHFDVRFSCCPSVSVNLSLFCKHWTGVAGVVETVPVDESWRGYVVADTSPWNQGMISNRPLCS